MTEIANQILHTYLQTSRQMAVGFQGCLGRLNLTYPQTVTLMILDEDGPMPISELAGAVGSANSTISGVVDRLERLGLVRRERSEQDRRKIFVEVTEQFMELKQETASYASDRFAQALSGLSEEEQGNILHGLKLLGGALGE